MTSLLGMQACQWGCSQAHLLTPHELACGDQGGEKAGPQHPMEGLGLVTSHL